LLATRSGHEVPAASAVNAITYGFTPTQKVDFFKSLYRELHLSEQMKIILMQENVPTCDAAYLICNLGNPVGNTTYEDQGENKSDPAMCNLIWWHKSKRYFPRCNDRGPTYYDESQADRIYLPLLRTLQLHILK
jgi:hypothetical protein